MIFSNKFGFILETVFSYTRQIFFAIRQNVELTKCRRTRKKVKRWNFFETEVRAAQREKQIFRLSRAQFRQPGPIS
jgi:hypothetical protein